jgi:hypothetical protein
VGATRSATALASHDCKGPTTVMMGSTVQPCAIGRPGSPLNDAFCRRSRSAETRSAHLAHCGYVQASVRAHRVFGIRTRDGGTVDLAARKDASGAFTALTHATLKGTDGRERRAGFAEPGRVASLTLTEGVVVDLAWRDDQSGTLAVRVDGRAIGPSRSRWLMTRTSCPSLRRLSLTSNTVGRCGVAPAQPVFVQVTNRCGRAVINAEVDLQIQGTYYSAVLRLPWSGQAGIYTGNVPSGPDQAARDNYLSQCQQLPVSRSIAWAGKRVRTSRRI